MRQVLKAFVSKFGTSLVPLVIWLLFIIMGYVFVSSTIKRPQNSILFAVIFITGILYALSFPITEERAHLVKFGVLGWLLARDYWDKYKERVILGSILIAFIVAMLDESLQYFLPYRVSDIRDVIFGTIGGLWGGALYCASRTRSIANFGFKKNE